MIPYVFELRQACVWIFEVLLSLVMCVHEQQCTILRRHSWIAKHVEPTPVWVSVVVWQPRRSWRDAACDEQLSASGIPVTCNRQVVFFSRQEVLLLPTCFGLVKAKTKSKTGPWLLFRISLVLVLWMSLVCVLVGKSRVILAWKASVLPLSQPRKFLG